jgi:predicted LPLAT superfamily acyltransferase
VTVSWTQERERGSQTLLQVMAWLTLRCGWRVGRILIVPITAYFFVTSLRARAASRAYLSRLFGRPARWHEVFRHFLTFAATLLDRPFFLTSSLADYEVAISGLEHLAKHWKTGRGCILLGSHLGSFEVMRACAEVDPRVRVRALMHEGTGASVALFRGLNPILADKIIQIGNTGSMLQVKEAIDGGEMVGILGDRIARGDKAVTAGFLGAPAAFSAGPYVLSTLLEAPIVLCFGLYLGGRRYEIVFEPFFEGGRLARERRAEEIGALAARYAERLAAHCRRQPYNWFNFYDFWNAGSPDAPPRPEA